MVGNDNQAASGPEETEYFVKKPPQFSEFVVHSDPQGLEYSGKKFY
jgi:hypothetical protein